MRGLTANTAAQAIYYSGVLDGNNQPMTGEKRYIMILKPPMDYAKAVPPGFWSVTMYDRVTNYTPPNPINRLSPRRLRQPQEECGWIDRAGRFDAKRPFSPDCAGSQFDCLSGPGLVVHM